MNRDENKYNAIQIVRQQKIRYSMCQECYVYVYLFDILSMIGI